MHSEVADLARAAGTGLAASLRQPDLPRQVERRILLGDDAEAPEQMPALEAVIALAAFVLACAEFAYTVYKDQRDRNEAPDKSAIKQRVQLDVRSPALISVETRDEVIRVVVDRLT